MDAIVQNPIVALSIFATIMAFLLFFSIAEASLLSVNRYRIYHLSRQGSLSARAVQSLLNKPNQLLSLLLLGNSFLNNVAATLVTLLTVHYLSPEYIYLSILLLTIASLVFVEIAPKTIATEHPDTFAAPSAVFCIPLIALLAPIVWLLGVLTQFVLLPFRLLANKGASSRDLLNRDEIKTLLSMPGSTLQKKHQQMMTSILDLDSMRVEEVMVPRQDIEAIDINRPFPQIMHQLRTTGHSTLPVYDGDYSKTLGVIQVRDMLELALSDRLNLENIKKIIEPVVFSHEGTNLAQQLNMFQSKSRSLALVQDEIGNTIGLVTIEHILEEIIGAYTEDKALGISKKIVEESPQQFLVHGSVSLRQLNQLLPVPLVNKNAKTFNGFLLGLMKSMPKLGDSMYNTDYRFEIVKCSPTMVLWSRISFSKKGKLISDASET